MYNYIIIMKNGKEFKIKSKLKINELINDLFSKDKSEIIVHLFNLIDTTNKVDKAIAIIILELDSNFFKWFNEDNNKHRTNKLLIKVIEEVEENQSCDIVIREIPNDIEWEIYEIEGIETIHEKHRIW